MPSSDKEMADNVPPPLPPLEESRGDARDRPASFAIPPPGVAVDLEEGVQDLFRWTLKTVRVLRWRQFHAKRTVFEVRVLPTTAHPQPALVYLRQCQRIVYRVSLIRVVGCVVDTELCFFSDYASGCRTCETGVQTREEGRATLSVAD